MIITVKTLQQKSFKVEIDEAETVLAMKKKIEEEQGAGFPAASTRLIYAGKILSDTSTISDYKIQESNFVVVMPSKSRNVSAPKPQPSTSTTPAAPPSTPAQQTTSTPAPTPQETSTSETAPPQVATDMSIDPTPADPTPTPTSVVVAPSVQPSSEAGEVAMSTDRGGDEASGEGWNPVSEIELPSGSDRDEAIASLMAMGFERDAVVVALQASFNNLERAAEYLVHGIPEGLLGAQPSSGAESMQGTSPPQLPLGGTPVVGGPPVVRPPVVGPPGIPGGEEQLLQAGNPAGLPVSEAGGPAGGAGENPLEFLRRQPHFAQLRNTLQQNPNMLPALLQQIGQSNPSLLNVISQNQQAFIELLNDPPQDSAPAGQQGGASGLSGGQVSIPITAEEKQVIDRLKSMGFEEYMVIQIFLACDKDEERTLDILLSMSAEDRDN